MQMKEWFFEIKEKNPIYLEMDFVNQIVKKEKETKIVKKEGKERISFLPTFSAPFFYQFPSVSLFSSLTPSKEDTSLPSKTTSQLTFSKSQSYKPSSSIKYFNFEELSNKFFILFFFLLLTLLLTLFHKMQISKPGFKKSKFPFFDFWILWKEWYRDKKQKDKKRKKQEFKKQKILNISLFFFKYLWRMIGNLNFFIRKIIYKLFSQASLQQDSIIQSTPHLRNNNKENHVILTKKGVDMSIFDHFNEKYFIDTNTKVYKKEFSMSRIPIIYDLDNDDNFKKEALENWKEKHKRKYMLNKELKLIQEEIEKFKEKQYQLLNQLHQEEQNRNINKTNYFLFKPKDLRKKIFQLEQQIHERNKKQIIIKEALKNDSLQQKEETRTRLLERENKKKKIEIINFPDLSMESVSGKNEMKDLKKKFFSINRVSFNPETLNMIETSRSRSNKFIRDEKKTQQIASSYSKFNEHSSSKMPTKTTFKALFNQLKKSEFIPEKQNNELSFKKPDYLTHFYEKKQTPFEEKLQEKNKTEIEKEKKGKLIYVKRKKKNEIKGKKEQEEKKKKEENKKRRQKKIKNLKGEQDKKINNFERIDSDSFFKRYSKVPETTNVNKFEKKRGRKITVNKNNNPKKSEEMFCNEEDLIHIWNPSDNLVYKKLDTSVKPSTNVISNKKTTPSRGKMTVDLIFESDEIIDDSLN